MPGVRFVFNSSRLFAAQFRLWLATAGLAAVFVSPFARRYTDRASFYRVRVSRDHGLNPVSQPERLGMTGSNLCKPVQAGRRAGGTEDWCKAS